jgi:ubiquinone/menaquinone biosynthesis C-methylase UbiE
MKHITNILTALLLAPLAVLHAADLRRKAGASRARRRGQVSFVRGDIRHLPFADARFGCVIAAYGILQSLLSERDLIAALQSASRVLKPRGLIGIDLVPDVPKWREYDDRVQMRGRTRGGVHLTLIESVRQHPRRRMTTFEQRYVVRRGRDVREHKFELTFRTVTVPTMSRLLERAGFQVRAVLGDYRGREWDARADVWILLAEKV